MKLHTYNIPTPCYVCDEEALEANAKKLWMVQERTGCKIILALKAFSMYHTFPILQKYLAGTTASSLNEARLGYEEFGKEVHIYSPAYLESEIEDLIRYGDHIIFNSFSQWNKYRDRVKKSKKHLECGIRLNPEYSEVEFKLYDPCAKYSRFGITAANFKPELVEGVEGYHFHTLSGSQVPNLERTLRVMEEKFGKYFHDVKWVNFGGGHHITKPNYDVDQLCRLIDAFQKKYGVQVIMEPGEAVAIQAGALVATVVDILHNEMDIAILDTSATAHMPDVLEMPYRPILLDSFEAGQKPYTYRLGGMTCLSGDVIGDYSFEEPLQVGQKMVFLDMAQYTMVKNTNFNGIPVPAIATLTKEKELKVIKQFDYEHFKGRL